MEPLADRTHMIIRGEVWYYKRRVPEHLVAIFEKPFIQQSLKTKSESEARLRRSALDVRYELEFRALDSHSSTSGKSETLGTTSPTRRLTEEEIHNRVVTFVDNEFGGFKRRYLDRPAGTTAELDEVRVSKEIDLQTIRDLDHPEQQMRVAMVFEKVFADADFDGVSDAGAAEVVRRGLANLFQREIAYLSDSQLATNLPSKQSHSAPLPGHTFASVAKDYLDDEREKARLNKRRPQWFEKIQGHVNLLIEAIGKDTPIAAVDYRTAVELRDIVAKLPAHRDKRYPGLSVQVAIERGKTDASPLLSPTSQAVYLDFFRNIMALAATQRLIPNNPAETVRPLLKDTVSAADKRKPFSPKQICEFFSSGFYQRWQPGHGNPYEKPDRDWRFWLPLLMAMTGMRPGEICQCWLETLSKLSPAFGLLMSCQQTMMTMRAWSRN